MGGGGGGMKKTKILLAAFRPSRAVNRKNYFYLRVALADSKIKAVEVDLCSFFPVKA